METTGSDSAEYTAGTLLMQAGVIPTARQQGFTHDGSWGCLWVARGRGGGPSCQNSGPYAVFTPWATL